MSKPIGLPDISIVLPCLNEEEAISSCLSEIQGVIEKNNLIAEVIVVDNGSKDKSLMIANSIKASFPELIVLQEQVVGYGSAYMMGLKESRGQYIFMSDIDHTYSFEEFPKFIQKLKEGNDLVVGNRFTGKMEKGSMPWHHYFIGNPVLSFFVKLFFKIKINDIHCGSRAITKNALSKIVLYTRGMEFASEMIIKAAKKNLVIAEIPISYKRRLGDSKLNSFSDGWRHLRFILLYSPTVIFLLPGLVFFIFGLLLTILLYFSNLNIFGRQLYFHPMFITAIMTIVGYQFLFFAGFARTYAITHLGDSDKGLEKMFKYITLERASILGLVLAISGFAFFVYIYYIWAKSGFGSLDQVKNSIFALIFIVLGIQTVSSSFMLSILGIKEK